MRHTKGRCYIINKAVCEVIIKYFDLLQESLISLSKNIVLTVFHNLFIMVNSISFDRYVCLFYGWATATVIAGSPYTMCSHLAKKIYF